MKKIYSVLGRLPFTHALWIQRVIWEKRNWSCDGEEWTVSEAWKESLTREVLLPHIKESATVLEIGPGAGRWTKALQQVAGRLYLVDISSKCIDLCRKKFRQFDNIRFFVNDGKSLHFISDETIDFVWSFDTFVHILPQDILSYLEEIYRVLKTGGRGIIHHAGEGSRHGGWRSQMTDTLFARMLKDKNLKMIRQLDSWGGGKFDVRTHHDVLSLFEKGPSIEKS